MGAAGSNPRALTALCEHVVGERAVQALAEVALDDVGVVSVGTGQQRGRQRPESLGLGVGEFRRLANSLIPSPQAL
jgi:hypothetical protein